jgi:hypothetical protein
VKLNNLIGPDIKSFKGVRQGDPLSPILFNFVADGLSRMILKAQANGLFTRLFDHIIDNGVAVLQNTDDTIIYLKHCLEGARNMKLLLYMYELMAGLKINFYKSEVLTLMMRIIGKMSMLTFSIVKLVLFLLNTLGCKSK